MSADNRHGRDEYYEDMQLDFIQRLEEKQKLEDQSRSVYIRPTGVRQLILDATAGLLVRMGNEG